MGDADGDGINDTTDLCPNEAGTAFAGGCLDVDQDGVPDDCLSAATGACVVDACLNNAGPANADPTKNGCPLPTSNDADQDGITDNIDVCPTIVGDSSASGCPDADQDTVPNDCTSAAPGTCFVDACPTNVGPANTIDPTKNGCPLPTSGDADGDGINDTTDLCPNEAGTAFAGGCLDIDQDGVPDDCMSATTGACVIDACLDSAGPANADPTKNGCPVINDDLDNDGIPNDHDNCAVVPNADQLDNDQDGLGNACDPTRDGSPPVSEDTDQDGISDSDEIASLLYPSMSPLKADSDGDGICDGPASITDANGVFICTPNPKTGLGDNCPIVSNGPNTPGITSDDVQKDSNGNGIGDACEDDMDGDTILDEKDNCAIIPNSGQEDSDKDGTGDVCETTKSTSTQAGGGCSLGTAPAEMGGILPLLFTIVPLGLFRARKRK
jgi:hypothetical protein